MAALTPEQQAAYDNRGQRYVNMSPQEWLDVGITTGTMNRGDAGKLTTGIDVGAPVTPVEGSGFGARLKALLAPAPTEAPLPDEVYIDENGKAQRRVVKKVPIPPSAPLPAPQPYRGPVAPPEPVEGGDDPYAAAPMQSSAGSLSSVLDQIRGGIQQSTILDKLKASQNPGAVA